MPYLHRPGGSIYYDDTGGDGIPVITTHGFIENSSYWALSGVSDVLVENGYRVLGLDLRGHGRSIPSDRDPDYGEEAVLADISALADAHGFDKFHLLTHATGGMVGTRYAMKHHERLRSLVATNTASATLPVLEYADLEWDNRPIPALDENDPAQSKLHILKASAMKEELLSGKSFVQIVSELRADLRNHMLGVFFHGFARNADPEKCWRAVEQMYAVNNPKLCAEFADAFFQDPDPRIAALRQIGCPTLVLVGELDHVMVKFSEQLARNIPGAEYVLLNDVGHMTAIEDLDRTSAALLDFFNRHDAS